MVAREESITSPHNLGPEYADYVLRDGSEWVVLVSDIMANRFLNPSGWEEFSDTDGWWAMQRNAHAGWERRDSISVVSLSGTNIDNAS